MKEQPSYTIHAGHRERMREKFLGCDVDRMPTHELLEILLFYSIPRQNTNETAHRLLDCFGSLENVLFADEGELMSVTGIKQSSATLLSLCGEMLRRVMLERKESTALSYSYHDVADYLRRLYVGVTVERVYLMLFDNAMRLLDCVLLTEGTVNHAQILPRDIIRHAIMKNAAGVIIAHNHPSGLALPSGEDIENTHRLNELLGAVDITLIEHMVVGESGRVTPILYEHLGGERALSGTLREDDLRSFYETLGEKNPKEKRENEKNGNGKGGKGKSAKASRG